MGFAKMGLDPKLIEGIKLMGIKDPTPIQAKCIPHLKAGKDLVGQSLTGSGKTAAFGLPILEKIVPGAGLQALIITPTRELCVQVRDNLESMARYLPINVKSVYGGVGFFQQIEDLKIAEIIVATPGRLLDHMGRRNVDLRTIKFVVLDEADRMFDMGFEDDIDKILRQTPNQRQTIMFSATMPKAAQHIANKYLKNPVYVQEQLQVDRSLMTQVFYSVKKEDKFSLLVHLLKTKTSGPAIVFCGTKREVDRVARNLRKEKVDALPVHGDLTQGKRQFAVNSFKLGKIDVLVATDVAARGLDIKDVSHVYNYDVPRTAEEYTHRIGRTARAGKKGDAVTLLSERDYQNFNKILKFGKQNIKQEATPIFERIEFKKDFHHGEDFGREEPEQGRGRRERPWSDRRDRPRFDRRERPSFDRGNRSFGSSDGSRGNYSQGSSDGPRQSSYPSNFSRDRPRRDFSNATPYQRDRPSHLPRANDFRPRNDFAQRERPTNVRDETNLPASGHERTPRTLEPLFPESHYHPSYKPKPDTERVNTVRAVSETFRPARMHRPSYPTDKNKSFHSGESRKPFSHDSRRSSEEGHRAPFGEKKHYASKEGKPSFYKPSAGKGKFHGKKRF